MNPPLTSPVGGQLQAAAPVVDDSRTGEREELGKEQDSETEGPGFDLNAMEVGGAAEEDAEVTPARFLGDSYLLYNAESLSSAKATPHGMMVFQGAVNGRQALVLLDLGANCNFVSKQWAESTGIDQRPLKRPEPVATATGQIYTATSQLMGTVRVVGTSCKMPMVVVPLSTYDVILGTPWFKANNPQFDWSQWTCNGRRVYSCRRGGRSVGRPGHGSSRLQSMVVGAGFESGMQELLTKYKDVFASKLPRRVFNKDAVNHSFELEAGAKPVVDGERRRSPAEEALIKEMVREGIAAGIMEPSKSPWKSQLHMVTKKDQFGRPRIKPRFTVDYRRVNHVMKKDAFPLPLPEVLFAHLKGATIFSKLDLTKGFYQIGLAPECREQLAFSTPDGLMQWLVMPFGIANAPAAFQREMQRVLKEQLGTTVLVFLDDILVFSKDETLHAQHVEWVLQRLRQFQYYANPDKCEFFQRKVNFLGHVITAGGLAVQQHKVDAIVDWPTPRCVKDVMAFLGLTGYYRRFVLGHSSLATPLSDLTKKDAAWVWGTKEQAAFDKLKQALSTAPVLVTPDNDKPYVMHTDASNYAIGATLSQWDDGQRGLRPVAFMSKKMSPAQRNYTVHEWELLAVVEALKAWRCYLYGSAAPIHIFTDHHSLQYISTQPHLSPRQHRWVEQLQDYSFKIHHLPGDKNVVADALSRRSDHEQAHARETQELLSTSAAGGEAATRPRLRLELAGVETRQQSRAAQAAAAVPTLRVGAPPTAAVAAPQPAPAPASRVRNPAVATILSDELMPRIRAAALTDTVYYQPLLAQARHLGLTVKDGLVYGPVGQLYIPKDDTLRCILMREVHDAPTGGHLGREKTFRRLTAAVYWRGVYRDVEDYIGSCVACASSKASNRTSADLLHPLPIPARRWETITMDFQGPLPKTEKGNDFLLVVMCKLSKETHLIACKQTVTAAQVARLIYDNVVRLHGFPESIISDRDTRFTSHFWTALWKLSGTKLSMSSSYHPQTDGQTENVNRVVQNILRSIADDPHNCHDWDDKLTSVEIAYNSSCHASTGFSPHFLNNNQEMRLPFSIALSERIATSRVPAAAAVMTEMAVNDETARSRLAAAQQAQKTAADKHRRAQVYAVGEQVMLSTAHLKSYQHKLACRFVGPFAITAVGTGTVTLDLPADMLIHAVVNVDRVKRYRPSVGEWPGRVQLDRPLAVSVDDNGAPLWEVEAILGKKQDYESADGEVVRKKDKTNSRLVDRYLIQWVGYGMEECSWEPAEGLAGAYDLVRDYERRLAAETRRYASVMMLCLTEGCV